MNLPKDMKEFLVSRRAKVTPDQVGLPSAGRRRVPGLRREEVATLAGVSPDYYVQIERGRAGDVSDSVLYAIAGALLLNETEIVHLFDLAHSHNRHPVRRPEPGTERLPDGVQTMIDHLVGAAAVVQNRRLDLVAANDLGRALYSDLYEHHQQPNLARYVFSDDRAKEFYQDWDTTADFAVSILRAHAGKPPCDRNLTDLIGELTARSEEFRTRWAAHDVRSHQRGSKRLRHRLVGDLNLHYEGLEIPGTTGLTLFCFTAEPGDSATKDSLLVLASWAKTSPAEDDKGTAQTLQGRRESHQARHGASLDTPHRRIGR
ncbi:helix-turn-helix transcriptional regulator [Rhodococcus sp. WB9]|uniref:helix-turn-helix domain-containing protein n=1 Tax=Rhodococcus sp. WB9 TaxID=2594007 RepID=UPI001184A480|nr:helix-turn-helix transcriptional regulator [Rhodococcus sp. WB9]QDQ95087.1 helix-turn-helix transcriptional regulator [Rhodococcus sp. WB9]